MSNHIEIVGSHFLSYVKEEKPLLITNPNIYILRKDEPTNCTPCSF
jgi:hypothetical protein